LWKSRMSTQTTKENRASGIKTKPGRLIADITLAAKGRDLVRKAGIRLFGKDADQEKETV